VVLIRERGLVIRLKVFSWIEYPLYTLFSNGTFTRIGFAIEVSEITHFKSHILLPALLVIWTRLLAAVLRGN
jgi:hypothetical protein